MSEGAESSEPDASERSTASAIPEAEAREGYKWVQLGPKSIEIPNEWDVVTIEEVAERFISGGTPDSEEESYWGGDIPWTTCATVEGPFFEGCKSYITDEGFGDSSTSLVPKGSILFGTRVNVANVAKTLQDVAISQDLTGVVLDEEKVEADFVTWYLTRSQKSIRARYRQGSTIQGMLTSDLKSLKLPLPSLSEQRHIADILSTVDQQIQQTAEVVVESKSARRGIIQDLYQRDGVENPSSEPQIDEIREERKKEWAKAEREKKDRISDDTDVDLSRYSPPLDLLFSSRLPNLPNGWEWVSLDTLVAYDIDYRGKTPPYSDSGIPVISSGNIQDGGVDLSDDRFVSHDTYEEWLTRGVPKQGDLIVTTEAPVGKVAIYPDGQYLPTRRIIVLRTVGIDNSYLHAALEHPKVQSYLMAQSGGSTVGRILKENLLRTPIPLPPKDEQYKLSEVLTGISRQISIEEEREKRLKELKRGLMQDFLTGMVRVPTSIEAED